MSNAAEPAADGYSLDTNIVIDGRVRRYPPDVFPQVWDRLTELIEAERAVVCEEVHWELGRGDDECHAWAAAQDGLVVPSDEAVLEFVEQVVLEFPDWSSDTGNWADPFVIAHAAVREWVVVTDEHRSRSPVPARTKVPNVCEHFGIECVNFLDFARREGWSF